VNSLWLSVVAGIAKNFFADELEVNEATVEKDSDAVQKADTETSCDVCKTPVTMDLGLLRQNEIAVELETRNVSVPNCNRKFTRVFNRQNITNTDISSKSPDVQGLTNHNPDKHQCNTCINLIS